MYTATFANQTGTQSHKHHLSLELELRIRHSTNYKTTTTTCVYRVPNLYTPGNHNFHNLGPLGRWYTTWVIIHNMETSCVGIKKNNVVSYICYTNHTALEFFLAFSFFNLAFFNFGTTPPV